MPDNTPFTPDDFVPDTAQPQGFTPNDFVPDPEATKNALYGTPEQQGIAAVEGVAKGALGPLATMAEKYAGTPGEDIEARAAANPVTHAVSEIAGLAIPGSPLAGALGKAGEAASYGLEGAAATALKLGTENALFTVGDELSKEINGNPNSIQTAAAHVGLNGLIGSAAGYGLGKVSDLWKAKFGDEAQGFVKDFQDRLRAHAEGNIPTVDDIHAELATEHGNVQEAMDELRGAGGLKAQDIQKLLPDTISPEMVSKAQDSLKAVDDALATAAAKPKTYGTARIGPLEEARNDLASSIENSKSPADLYKAIDDFKKSVQGLGKWNVNEGEVQKPAAALIGKLSHNIRVGLEDTGVWGQAAERQAAINKVFSDYIPASNDFNRTFGEKVGGEYQVSPTKVQTLLNGLGKPNAEIRLEKLSNYLKSNDSLYEQLGKIHENLGVENPYQRAALTSTRGVLNDITPGMKAADFVRTRAVDAASEAAGSGVGAIAGHLSGIPGGEYLGAAFGHYAAKPFIRGIMPTLIRPLLSTTPSGEGIKGALDAVTAIMKGDSLLTDGSKALFEAGGNAVLNELIPDKDKLDKLDAKISAAQKDPGALLNTGGSMGQYLPQHATALASTVQNAINYLYGEKPQVAMPGVLNAPVPPTEAQMAPYRRSLSIAEQPLVVLSYMNKGTLQPKDVKDLSTMYPALHQKLIQKINNSMTEHMSKGHSVPFRMRGGLGMLMGQPMDSTFSTPSIMAAQATYVPAQPPQMPQGTSKAKKGTSKLGKSAELAQTPSEARQADLKS